MLKSQYCDFTYKSLKLQNQGEGVYSAFKI